MNQIKAPLIISPQKLPKRRINSTYVPSKEKDTQSNIVSKPSRNAEYFKSILDFPKAFSRTYHNDQLNKGIKDQLKTIYKEDKVLNTNIESIQHKYTKTTEDIDNSKYKSPIASKMLITQQKSSIPKISLSHLDEYYNTIGKELSARSTDLTNNYYSSGVSNNVHHMNTLSDFNYIHGYTEKNILPKTMNNFHKKNVSFNKKRPIDEIMANTFSSDIKKKEKNGIINLLTTSAESSRENKKKVHPFNLPPSLPLSTDIKVPLSDRAFNTAIYKLPESLHSVRTKLGTLVKTLAKESVEGIRNITNDQILRSLDKTKQSEYSQDVIEKIKIINNFISLLPKEKFRSDIVRHRKMFVIIDGTVVFNKEIIAGQFIDIPTRRFLQFTKSKKECLEKYYEFLAECQKRFRTTIPFKNVFLINGISISDLMEIPDCDNVLYVSSSNIFRGIFYFQDKFKMRNVVDENDYKLLKIQETKRARVKMFKHQKILAQGGFFMSIKRRVKNRRKKKNDLVNGSSENNKEHKKFKTIIKDKKYLLDQSFTFGITDKTSKEEYFYYSDSEEKQKKIKNNQMKSNMSLIDALIQINEQELQTAIKDIKKRNKKTLKNKLAQRINEETEEGLDSLIREYNKKRAEQYKINVQHDLLISEEKLQEKEVQTNMTSLGGALLDKLQIFKALKNTSNIVIDEDKFYNKTQEKETAYKNSFTYRNILKVYDITPTAEREVNKFYPDLISLNIPRVLRTFPKLKRTTFYEIFIQFKLLLTICVCINNDLKKIKNGIDFQSFFNCLPQMRSQGTVLALKIYNTLNLLNSDCINWEEYLRGMLTMKSKNISEKIDMFFKVIDTDGNGLLSFDEVYELSKASLERTIGDKKKESEEEDKNDVVTILATYFANLIFQLVDKPIDEEIPLDLIKDKIIEGKSAAGYLEMFICADSFT